MLALEGANAMSTRENPDVGKPLEPILSFVQVLLLPLGERYTPPLPPNVDPGGHGGAEGQLMNEFVTAILQDRTPWCNIAEALNMTVAGVVASQSAKKDGELLKIPQYTMPT